MRLDQTNMEISSNTNVLQGRREPKRRSPVSSHAYEKAQLLEVWQVARAATAIPFYFEPIKIESAQGVLSMLFASSQVISPARTGTQEIGDLHGHSSVGIVVSVGTARTLESNAKKATFFSTIPDAARDVVENMRRDQESMENDLKMLKES